MAGSILEDHQQTANEDLVLSDIQEYLKRKDICIVVREKWELVGFFILVR